MQEFDTPIKKEDNPVLEEAIRRAAEGGRISCAEAMRIAVELGESPLALGRLLDQVNIRLGKCRLGLLGCIHPENRTVQIAPEVSPELEEEIRESLRQDCLPCAAAWLIAERRSIPMTDVSASCECLKIRIKPCQFGVF